MVDGKSTSSARDGCNTWGSVGPMSVESVDKSTESGVADVANSDGGGLLITAGSDGKASNCFSDMGSVEATAECKTLMVAATLEANQLTKNYTKKSSPTRSVVPVVVLRM